MLAVNVVGVVFTLLDRKHLARADVMSNIAFCVPITAFAVVGALIDVSIPLVAAGLMPPLPSGETGSGPAGATPVARVRVAVQLRAGG